MFGLGLPEIVIIVTNMRGGVVMKRLVIGCMLSLLFAASAGAAEKNLVELHKHAGKLSSKECLACHGNIKKDVASNKKFKTFHRVHLESKLETPKNCADCHQSVDVMNRSAAALRKQVDPQICAGCHNGGVKGAEDFFAN